MQYTQEKIKKNIKKQKKNGINFVPCKRATAARLRTPAGGVNFSFL